MHGSARASPEVVMFPFIILLACMFAGATLHLYQMLSLLVWIARRAQCTERCDTVVSPGAPAIAVISLSAEPPDSPEERRDECACH
jgi:prepilin signal peptidase PulO-like enzyme (type II secretory pathway)